MPRAERKPPVVVGGVPVPAGRVGKLEIPVATLPTGSGLSIPVAVVNGRQRGPTVWISGAIHGDELNGVEIVRRLLRHLDPRSLHGTVIAVPVVNVFGFLGESRYLPDGRDLNRSFPGSRRGSIAARLARLFLDEVVRKCEVGIDLHTASGHRVNIPQVRADLDDPETARLTRAFGAPFAVHARLRDGSVREAATRLGIRVLVYEAGQVHRFDEDGIRAGVHGVLRTFEALGLGTWDAPPPSTPTELRTATWVRARRSGIATITADLGDLVERGEKIGEIGDTLGGRPTSVTAPVTGWVIAKTQNPLISQGDAVVHVGAEK